MNYDDVIAAVFQPSAEGVTAAPTRDASPARRLRDAIEPIAMHSVWCRSTNEAQAGLGLDFMGGYVMGRASLLGRPTAGTVTATFAVFEPGLVESVYNDARERCDRDELWATRTAATIASLTEVLAEVDVAATAHSLATAVSQAAVAGRPLFAGLMSQEWPDDPVGKLWRACELLREHRGDSHVAACVASSLDPIEMNILTEVWVGMPLGSYTASRGWGPDLIAEAASSMTQKGWLEADELTAAGRALRNDIEATTDQLQQPIVDSLGSEMEQVIVDLHHWSQLCIDARAFPPDVFKRAAG